MIIILVEATVPEANRERFLELAKRHAADSGAEEACFAFDVYEDPFARGSVRFVEEWRSADDLEAHLATEHTQTFLKEALPLLEGSQVRRFEARELA